MNEAMPRWRTFSSEATVDLESTEQATPRGAAASRGVHAPLALLLGIAGAGLGAVAAVLLLLGSGLAPSMDILAGSGEPLEDLAAMDPMAVAPVRAVGPISARLIVDVAGAVARPGLQHMRPGDRVGDAIAAAGGYAPQADLAEASRSLNLALPLTDGTKVLVPELGFTDSEPAAAGDGRIDLNRADQSSLESLPGIGPVTAGKIIDARSDKRFASVRELRSRGVVGESVFGKIKGLIRVGR